MWSEDWILNKMNVNTAAKTTCGQIQRPGTAVLTVLITVVVGVVLVLIVAVLLAVIVLLAVVAITVILAVLRVFT